MIDSVSTIPATDHFQFIEVGSQSIFNEHHLPGAICLSRETLDNFIQKERVNSGKEYILYAQDPQSSELVALGETLLKYGYFNIYIYKDGKTAWLSHGLTHSSSKSPEK
jgi:rhodanese-related sulfurtransferase